jgi:hypothetical protein
MFLHSKETRIIIFFFYHRGIGIEPSNLELRLVITRDDNIVDLNIVSVMPSERRGDSYLENHAAKLGSKQKLLALADQGVNGEVLAHV